MMNAQRDGFLAFIPAERLEHAKKTSAEAISLATRVNRVALDLINSKVPLERDSDYFAGPLYARTIQNFEGCVMLAIFGMRVESRTLARSTLESACYCIAACMDLRDDNDRPFVHRVLGSHDRYRERVVRELKEMGTFDQERAEQWKAAADKIDATLTSLPGINLLKLMEDVGWGGFYTVLFRPLSQDAHPSADSLDLHCKFDASGELAGFVIGPDLRVIDDTIAAACAALLLAVEKYRERFSITHSASDFEGCLAAYKSLVERNAAEAVRNSPDTTVS